MLEERARYAVPVFTEEAIAWSNIDAGKVRRHVGEFPRATTAHEEGADAGMRVAADQAMPGIDEELVQRLQRGTDEIAAVPDMIGAVGHLEARRRGNFALYSTMKSLGRALARSRASAK